MICPKCHKVVPDDAMVCPFCGADLSEKQRIRRQKEREARKNGTL